MSAELDRKANGEAAVLSIGASPWHREGTILLDPTDPEYQRLSRNLEPALAEAGLDFDVKKFPTFFQVPGSSWDKLPDGRVAISPEALKKAEGGFAVVRTDRMDVLGNVGADYVPLQNREAFGPAKPLLEQGMATVETAGSLRGGADTWLLLRLDPEGIMKAAERMILEKAGPGASLVTRMDALEEYLDELAPFAHFANAHDGSRAAIVQECPIRVVCWNTQSAAVMEREGEIRYSVRHTGDVQERYAEAADRLFGDLAKRYLSLANARVVLKAVTLPQEPYERIVLERAVPVKHLEEKVRNREGNARTEAALERNHRLRDEIHRLWTDGKGHTGDRSAWEAYQGLVEFLDHSPDARFGESRLASLRDGTLGKVKDRVFKDLVHWGNDHAPDVIFQD